MGFLDDYEPVDERNAKFWIKYPDGRIITDLVFDDGQRFTFRCELYRDGEAARPFATGYATENVTNSGVNKTSALENAETSAEGRALARGGFAPKGARPSREEMQKAQRGQQDPQSGRGEQPRNGARANGAARPAQEQPAEAAGPPKNAQEARAQLATTCNENGWDLGIVAARFREIEGMELGQATDRDLIVRFRASLFSLSDASLKAPAANGASR